MEPQFCVLVAAMLLALPLPWVAGWFLAAAVHEMFHCFALLLHGRKICHISIGVNGARIRTEDLTWGETVFCSLAGPFGGFLLLSAAKRFPQLALCGLLQSVYNLLPVFPLDGGRAWQGITHLLFPERLACRLCRGAEHLTLLLIMSLGFVSVFIWKLGIFPLVLAAIFTLRMMHRKIPCK